jgi:ribonuclease D
MPFNTDSKFKFVDTPEGLDRLVSAIKDLDLIAVDLEADSMYHFQDKVCLIQLAVGHQIFIVDPIKLESIELLKSIFIDNRIRKIFHGADYDIRSLFRDFDIVIHNLFDTELACRFLGIQQSGLNAVIQSFFRVKLEKKYQKKDWSQRPLPHDMINYAAKDVQYLLQLSDILKKKLIQKNRLSWVEEECQLLSTVRPNTNHDAPLFLNFRGAGKLNSSELAVLEEILIWRRETARKKDRPLFKILGNHHILKLVHKKPRNTEELDESKLLSSKQLHMFGRQLLTAIQRGLNIPDDDLPVYPRRRAPRMSEAASRKAGKLKNWKEARAKKLSIDPALVLTKMQIIEIAKKTPANLQDLSGMNVIKAWQVREFGEEIIGCLKQ